MPWDGLEGCQDYGRIDIAQGRWPPLRPPILIDELGAHALREVWGDREVHLGPELLVECLFERRESSGPSEGLECRENGARRPGLYR